MNPGKNLLLHKIEGDLNVSVRYGERKRREGAKVDEIGFSKEAKLKIMHVKGSLAYTERSTGPG